MGTGSSKGDSTAAAHAEYEITIKEHRDLCKELCEIEEWLDRPPDAPAALLATLAERLRRLRATLERHFAREEQGAFHDELPTTHPRFARALHRLLAEHADLVMEIASLAEECDPTGDRSEAAGALCRRTRLVVGALRRHESEENEILQLVYYDDLGTSE